jgi:hypothetical protein
MAIHGEFDISTFDLFAKVLRTRRPMAVAPLLPPAAGQSHSAPSDLGLQPARLTRRAPRSDSGRWETRRAVTEKIRHSRGGIA